jgi:murein tripeptide amidase MpaA
LLDDNDTAYLAHCYPYTYSDLSDFIRNICTFQNKEKVRRTVLCRSLAGNDVEMLIVTNFSSHPEAIAQRKAIILSARIHPGESNSSYMSNIILYLINIVNGVIEYLVSDDEGADFLRNTFVFKIIPMLNPDGVIVGNYRCSLVGQDLNRQWIGPSSKLYPENYHTKLMMRKTLESRDIYFFCDFHGHSTNRNIFMFGNA